jgi:hypothetical protein
LRYDFFYTTSIDSELLGESHVDYIFILDFAIFMVFYERLPAFLEPDNEIMNLFPSFLILLSLDIFQLLEILVDVLQKRRNLFYHVVVHSDI